MTEGDGGVLSIKDIIEIIAIFVVGAGVVDAIRHDQINSPNQREHSSGPTHETGNQTDGAVVSGVLESINTKPETKPKKQKWWKNPKRVEHIIQAATLLFVAAYTVITLCLLLGAKEANQIGRESFTAVQRAFITIDGLDITPLKSAEGGQITHWMFKTIIKKSGNTPTKNMRWALGGEAAGATGEPITSAPGLPLPSTAHDPDMMYDTVMKMRQYTPRALLGPQTSNRCWWVWHPVE